MHVLVCDCVCAREKVIVCVCLYVYIMLKQLIKVNSLELGWLLEKPFWVDRWQKSLILLCAVSYSSVPPGSLLHSSIHFHVSGTGASSFHNWGTLLTHSAASPVGPHTG